MVVKNLKNVIFKLKSTHFWLKLTTKITTFNEILTPKMFFGTYSTQPLLSPKLYINSLEAIWKFDTEHPVVPQMDLLKLLILLIKCFFRCVQNHPAQFLSGVILNMAKINFYWWGYFGQGIFWTIYMTFQILRHQILAILNIRKSPIFISEVYID